MTENELAINHAIPPRTCQHCHHGLNVKQLLCFQVPLQLTSFPFPFQGLPVAKSSVSIFWTPPIPLSQPLTLLPWSPCPTTNGTAHFYCACIGHVKFWCPAATQRNLAAKPPFGRQQLARNRRQPPEAGPGRRYSLTNRKQKVWVSLRNASAQYNGH